MKHYDINYLNDINNALRKNYATDLDIPSVIKDINDGKFKFTIDKSAEFDSKDYEWLEEFALVVNRIRSIVSKPRIHVKIEKEVLKSSIANSVDIAGFNMTVKDSKLWHINEIGEELPEFVYANIPEDDVTIYENRFITSLINKMYELISRNILKLYNEIISLDALLGKTNKVLDNFDILDDKCDDINLVLKDVLTSSEDPMIAVLQKMIYIKKRIVQVMGTVFYRKCMKATPLALANVMQTNVLIHDADYRFCYIYSRKVLNFNVVVPEKVIKTSSYANYVTINIINALVKNGYKIKSAGKAKFLRNRIAIQDLVMTKGDFLININTLDKALQLKTYFKTTPSNVTSDYDIKCSVTTIKFVLENLPDVEIRNIINKTCLTDHNCIIVTPNVLSHIDNVYTIVPSFYLTERNLNELARSLNVLFEGSMFVYSAKCPVCGSRIVVYDENINAFEDLTCGSLWSLIKDGSREVIWLKRFNP